MGYVFIGPTIQETPASYDILFCRYGIDRGISVIQRQDGTYYQARYPAQTELEESKAYYPGGHVIPLTSAEVTSLTAAGYGQYIHLQ